MFNERGWTVYSKLLTFTGVLPLYSAYKTYIVSLAAFNGLIILILIYNWSFRWKSSMTAYGSTGMESEYYQFMLNGVKHEIMSLWLLVNSNGIIDTINVISECEKNSKNPFNTSENHILRNFKINMICIITFEVNISFIKYFSCNKLFEMFTSHHSLAMLSYEIDFIRSSLFMTLYTVLVYKIQDILNVNHNRLEDICQFLTILKFRFKVEVAQELLTILDVRNRLLTLCFVDISYYFGVSILIISVELFVEFVQAPFYLTFDLSNDFAFEIRQKIVMNVWWLMKVIIFSRAFICNSIAKEVRLVSFTIFTLYIKFV